MKFLLPHRYKKIGVLIAPIGLSFWLAMQLGYVKQLIVFIFGQQNTTYDWSPYHIANVATAVIGFFSFLAGLYFICFSKEKIEDEMVQKTRLDSLQFAAILQIIATILGFLSMTFLGDPGEGGMLLFFILLVLLFWVAFISHFNYVLHIKYKQ